MIDLTELRDGGQDPASIAAKIASFLSAAEHTLELALYDVHLDGEHAAPIHTALAEVVARKVQVRLVYNVDYGRELAVPRPPISKPELVEALPIETRGVPGVPDLMHHKYVVRDGAAVLTGSTNWTDDSWAREENLLAIVSSTELAARYQQNFEELWQKRDVERSGNIDSAPIEIDGHTYDPGSRPGTDRRLRTESRAASVRQSAASESLRRCSPRVRSSAPWRADRDNGHGGLDIAGVLDATQIAEVIQQWRDKMKMSWKEQALRSLIANASWSGKHSTPWTPDSVHDYMHAKIVVADDVVFFGSFNLSRSGESNAENTLEIEDGELAGRLAAFIDDIRGRYPKLELPD